MGQLFQDLTRGTEVPALIKTMRLGNAILMGLAVAASEVVAARGIPTIPVALAGFYIAFSLTAGVMITNDVFDLEIDRINRPDRPLPSGRLRKDTALTTAVLLFISGVAVSILGSWMELAFPLAVVSLFLSLAYNWKLKRQGLLGNAAVSFNVGLPFLYGAVMVGRPFTTLNLLFFFYAFAANMAREIIKGIPDMEGDSKRGMKTLAVKSGPRTAARLSFVILLADVIASPLPYFLHAAGLIYVALLLPGDALLAISATRTLINPAPEEASSSKKTMLLGMGLIVLAFLLAPLPRASISIKRPSSRRTNGRRKQEETDIQSTACRRAQRTSRKEGREGKEGRKKRREDPVAIRDKSRPVFSPTELFEEGKGHDRV